jgi:hypothetical protein
MNFIVKNSGDGKSYDLVKWVIEGRKFYKLKADGKPPEYYINRLGAYDECGIVIQNRCLVVFEETEKANIMHKYGLTYQEVETVSTIKNGYYRPSLREMEFAFDNLDLYLQYLIQRDLESFGNIKVVSFNKDSLLENFLQKTLKG